MKACLAIVWLIAAASAQAATLYKSVTPDGKIVYSDQPPTTGKVEQTFNFSNLPSTPVPESVTKYQKDLEQSMKNRLATGAGQPVLFTADWCRYCKAAEAYLAEKGIGYQRNDIDTASGRRAFQETGGRGVPVLLVGGQRVQGFSRPAYDALFRK